MESNKLTIKESSLSFLLSFLLCQTSIVFAVCFTFIGYKLCKLDSAEFSSFLSGPVGYLIQALALYSVMLLVFFLFNKNKQNKITKQVKIKKLIFYIVLAVLSFLTLYPIITCVDSLLVKLKLPINQLPYSLSTKNYFISLISLVVAPAICEELLFRGLIFRGLEKHGKVFSITISALMFSIYHMAISQTVYPLLMGLLLGVIMFYEGNIYYCIAIHMTNNFLSLTLSYFKINLLFNHWTYILIAIILLIVFLSLILFLTIRNNKKEEKFPISKIEKLYLFGSLGFMLLLWILINIL